MDKQQGGFLRRRSPRIPAGQDPIPLEHRSPLVRLFRRSLPFRIAASLAIAYVAILFVHWVEVQSTGQTICLPDDSVARCLVRELLSIVAVGNVESFSILTAAVLYLLETQERRHQADYEAWQAVDRAEAAGLQTSYARYMALQDLNERGVSLAGISIPGADLRRVRLVGADLSGADLSGADLSGADLRSVNLTGARLVGTKFTGAVLSESRLSEIYAVGSDWQQAKMLMVNLCAANLGAANLSGADLRGASLSRAELREVLGVKTNFDDTNLSRAILDRAHLNQAQFIQSNLSRASLVHALLTDAQLNHANLSHADLCDSNLTGATLNQANLSHARLRAIQVDSEQIAQALNWERAVFDEILQAQLPLGNYSESGMTSSK